jgi:hypothetical protein
VWRVSIIRHEHSPSKPVVETAIISAFVKYTGADSGVVGPEAYTILGALFKKRNTELLAETHICFESQKKSPKITNLSKPQIPQTSQNPEKKSTIFY